MFVPTLPTFNSDYTLWFPGHSPGTDPSDEEGVCQLYVNSRQMQSSFGGIVQIRVPFDVWDPYPKPIVNGIFQIGFWCYLIQGWEYTHLGFPNMYVTVYCEQCDQFGAVPDAGR